MLNISLVDHLPLGGVFLVTVALIGLALEAGYRLGGRRKRMANQEDKPPLEEMVAATLGLVAFLLAFTFGLAASRFDLRRSIVLDEANAIGTTYLRTSLIPEPQRSESRQLLREYVVLRIGSSDRREQLESVARSEAIHDRLWAVAVAATENDRKNNPVLLALYFQTLNELIDLHAKRVTLSVRNRIPLAIWGALFFVACLGMGLMGYHAGLAETGRSLAVLALVLTFSAVMVLIADLDRPREGLLQVDQSALMDVQRAMSKEGS
jgi:hypothetical protein